MLLAYTRFSSRHLVAAALFFVLMFLARTGYAQETTDTAITFFVKYRAPLEYKPFPITGRVIGTKLESIKEAAVVNICTGETTKADDNGVFHFRAAKGDTLAFAGVNYSPTVVGVRSPKDKFNVILIKRKALSLPRIHSKPDFEKAQKEDEGLYKILDKDAKEEGKWNY
jgi:hypothetical protein